MKKNLLIYIILQTIFIANAFALSTNLKSVYSPGETIIAEISGNILEPINNARIEFLRGHISIPLDFDLKKLENKYFLWASSPLTEENYTLKIKDIVTTIMGKIEITDLVQNFSVLGNLTDYSIKPGIISIDKDFSIEIQSNEDQQKSITLDFPSTQEIILKPGKNIIDFSIQDSSPGLREINIGKYKIPVLITKSANISNETMDILVQPTAIISTTLIGKDLAYPFRIINLKESTISGSLLEYDKDLFYINSSEQITIASRNSLELTLRIKSPVAEKFRKEGINEILKIKFDSIILNLPVSIRFTENMNEVKTPYLENETLYFCSELKGKQCSAAVGEICGGEIKASIEGACCIGICKKPEAKTSRKWIGYLIAGILFILLIIIFLKYRKTKSASNPIPKKLAEAEKKFKTDLP